MPALGNAKDQIRKAAEVARRPGGPRRLAAVAARRVVPGSVDDLPLEELIRLGHQMIWQRDPTVAEADRALARLQSGEISRLQFVEELVSEFGSLPFPVVTNLGYSTLLHRWPDSGGKANVMAELENGSMDRFGFLDWLRGSGEFVRLGSTRLGGALHSSRCQFIRSLPKADRILDLGGTDLGNPDGAFVSMGYPYDFSELVVIDLPPDDRHPLYQVVATEGTHQSARGPIRYEYHSMADLSRYETDSVDLVYSGQTIEHVTESDGDQVLREVRRVLRPGGVFALDTPNGTVCRLQQEAFIDPDHEIEYTRAQLDEKLLGAGYEIDATWGLVHGGAPVLEGRFSPEAAARNEGLYADVENCYLLAYVCRPV